MTKYTIIAVVLLICVGLAGFWQASNASAGGEDGDSRESARTPLLVSIAPVQHVTTVSQMREFTGTIKAARESSLAFERPGRIVEVLVDEGQSVAKGDLLARLDVELVHAQREAAIASLAQAKAVLAELQAGPRRETIAATRARVASLSAVAKRYENDLGRSRRLVDSGAISREQLEGEKFRWIAATSELDAAQKQLDELLAGTRPEKLAAQRATVASFEAQLNKLDLDIEDGELRAPFSGHISARLVDEGTVVGAGALVLSLVDDSQAEAWIGLPSSTAAEMRVGESYDLSLRGELVAGKLISLRPKLDPVTRTQNSIFLLDPNQTCTSRLVPGELIRLEIEEHVECNGLTIPSSALVPGTRGLWNVYTVDANTSPQVVERRSVELLYTVGDSSVVRGTLGDNYSVVVDGTHRVVHGQAVETEAWRSETETDRVAAGL